MQCRQAAHECKREDPELVVNFVHEGTLAEGGEGEVRGVGGWGFGITGLYDKSGRTGGGSTEVIIEAI